MFSVKLHSIFLLAFLCIITSTFFTLSHGVSHFNQLPRKPISGIQRRFAAEETTRNEISKNSFSALVLAERRTHRKDPSNGFKYYKGGWNIKNQHYLYSVGFTAAPLIVISAIWFLGFGLFLMFICIRYCCCQRHHYGYSRAAYVLSLVFLIFFTIAALIGCTVLSTGQAKFHDSTTDTLDYVVDQAYSTIRNLSSVSDYLSAAKGVGVDQVFLPPKAQSNIDRIKTKINNSATLLEGKTKNNSKDMRHALNAVSLALIITSAIMLLLAFLGFLFSVLGMKHLVHALVIFGWILVAVTFIICGLFLVLHNVVTDTCFAMDEWIKNPTANTSLDDILPCVDNATAQEALFQTKDVTSQLIDIVNWFITNVSNANVSLKAESLYYNQSGPLVPILCNPFYPDKRDRKCATGEVDLNIATQVWKNYVCQVSSRGICTTEGRLTPDYYHQMTASVNVSYSLCHYGPFLVDMVDCSFVRKTFSDIIRDYCPGLKSNSGWVYIGLIMVSVADMLSLVFWVPYTRERRHRASTQKFIALSAQDPSSGAEKSME